MIQFGGKRSSHVPTVQPDVFRLILALQELTKKNLISFNGDKLRDWSLVYIANLSASLFALKLVHHCLRIYVLCAFMLIRPDDTLARAIFLRVRVCVCVCGRIH